MAVVLGVLAIVVLGVATYTCSNHDLRGEAYPVHHLADITESAGRHGVDPYLVCAIISCESGWDEGAVSSAGAVGLMQLMPETAATLAGLGYVDDAAYPEDRLADPRVNIEYGCACLQYLSEQLDGTDEVVAAYNAGAGTVAAWQGEGDLAERITYPETAAYLRRVRTALDAYHATYPDGLTER